MIAAEQKARTTYDNILRMVKDPEVAEPIRFLRKREIVHFQRFGEVLRDAQEHLNRKNFYAFNPAFDLFQGPDCTSNTGSQPNISPVFSQQPQISNNQNGQNTCGYSENNR